MTNRLFFSGLLFIVVLGNPGPHGTLAYLSSSVQSTGNQFSAGTVHIANSLAMGATLSMDNLIGGEVERWPDLVAERGAHVHIYGKGEARRGRKMGHVTRVVR